MSLRVCLASQGPTSHPLSMDRLTPANSAMLPPNDQELGIDLQLAEELSRRLQIPGQVFRPGSLSSWTAWHSTAASFPSA